MSGDSFSSSAIHRDPGEFPATPRERTIFRQTFAPTIPHPSEIHWSRPYPPGNLWVRGVDKDGNAVWV